MKTKKLLRFLNEKIFVGAMLFAFANHIDNLNYSADMVSGAATTALLYVIASLFYDILTIICYNREDKEN